MKTLSRREFGVGVVSLAAIPPLGKLPEDKFMQQIRSSIAKYGLTDWTEAEIQMLYNDFLRSLAEPDATVSFYGSAARSCRAGCSSSPKYGVEILLGFLDDYLHCCVDPEFYRKMWWVVMFAGNEDYKDDFERRPYKKNLVFERRPYKNLV